MQIREAEPAELPEIASILDAAMLQTEMSKLEDAVDSGTVLVAVGSDASAPSTTVLLGAVVFEKSEKSQEPTEIQTIAVRPGRRGQGIGTALVTAVADRSERIVAAFDPRVRPFWEAVGFGITECSEDGRLRGEW